MAINNHEEREEVLRRGAAAIRDLQADQQPVQLHISKLDAVLLHGMLQLSLRHPGLPPTSRRLAMTAAVTIQQIFAGNPAISEMLSMSADPAFDTPEDPLCAADVNPGDVVQIDTAEPVFGGTLMVVDEVRPNLLLGHVPVPGAQKSVAPYQIVPGDAVRIGKARWRPCVEGGSHVHAG